MNRNEAILAGALTATAVAALWWWSRRVSASPDILPAPAPLDGITDALAHPVDAVTDAVKGWAARGEPYRAIITAAANHYGVPPDLLMRVAYQESHWRADIITGKTKSPTGAVGMFQFMPATAHALGVDPLNIASAADGAARYLAQNKNKFGTWSLALMAYNWGPGNVSKFLAGVKRPPSETRTYVASITSDTGFA